MPVTVARIAPTPSGYLHRGNLANFLLNARFVGPGDRLLLRIDDLDRARFRPEYLGDIFRAVRELDLGPIHGPTDAETFDRNWSQRQRMTDYRRALEHLRSDPLLFACLCSRKQLAGGRHAYACPTAGIDPNRAGVAWRLNTRCLSPVRIPDLVRPAFTVDVRREIPDFVVRTKAGMPSYQLACTVDDLTFGVTRVGRGEDLLASTAAQAILSDRLDLPPLFERISFLHHPLLTGPDGEKLSKSAGQRSGALPITTELKQELSALVDNWLST